MLIVEYSCPVEHKKIKVWQKYDLVLHVLSGQKSWETTEKQITGIAGDTIYLKKGGSELTQYFDQKFCMVGFYLTDAFIRETISDCYLKTPKMETAQFDLQKLNKNVHLSTYFASLLSYFHQGEPPISALLQHKLKEFIIQIFNDSSNQLLAQYFSQIGQSQKSDLEDIMERNYTHNLALKEFAALCQRSLSTFKRDFFKHYQMTPGRWLIQKRLEKAEKQLQQTDRNITEIAFDCGFEDLTHFSKAFKNTYHQTPSEYKKTCLHKV